MNTDQFKASRFGSWAAEQSHREFDRLPALQKEALDLLVESVRLGEITSIDGVDSPLARRIQAHHGVTQFEMNSNWIGADQNWKCPCCGRSKFQISRIGKKGQILAKLVVHHDHMGQVLEEAFNRAFVERGTQVAQQEGLRLVERMGRAFSAYDEVLICEDCNHADSEAKKLTGVPREFSFSIGQMHQFIQYGDHRPHQINAAIAADIWRKAEPAYRLRISLIEQVAHAAASDSHWHESFPNLAPVPTLDSDSYRLGDHDIKRWVGVEATLRALGPKSKVSAPNLAKWRTTRPKSGKPLPQNYVALLRTAPGSARIWDSVPDNWCCPTCNRDKSAVVYVGDKQNVLVNMPETSGRGAWARATRICGHCKTVLLALKHEVEDRIGHDIQNSYQFASPVELKSIIRSRPHCSHEVIPDRAAALVEVIVARQNQNGG